MTDRYCIHSNQTKHFHVSSYDLMTCCKKCAPRGICEGGSSERAWQYWADSGLVSGGEFGSNEGCVPYAIDPEVSFYINGYPTNNKCKKECQPEYNLTYQEDLTYGKGLYSVENDMEAIQLEIMNNGPVQAAFKAYQDFESFPGEVYQHIHSQENDVDPAGHSIRILGWGVHNATAYWLCANSWGTDWGEQGGFFKFVRGINNCGIEARVIAGLPRYE